MKNSMMLLVDKVHLKKRVLIETVNDELKNMYQVEYIRHRSFNNFIANMLATLITSSYFSKKPSINTINDIIDENRLID